MVKGWYVINGYDENFLVERQIASDIDGILKAIHYISDNYRVTSFTIHPLGEPPEKYARTNSELSELKGIRKELSNIVTALCVK